MQRPTGSRRLAWLGAALLAVAPASARSDSCPDRDPLRRPFFGDLHVHTVYSLDASTQQTRTRPAEAYRFARGAPIGLQPFDAEGRPLRHAQLDRALDFAAVTDHAELLGEWNICNTPGLPGHDSLVCRVYRRWPRAAFFWMNAVASHADRHGFCGEDGRLCREAARAPWQDIQRAAHQAYEPCRFTTFVGYEWTGASGLGNNLHRNVLFNGAAVPELPASFVETPSPPELWARLRQQCSGEDCDVVVIPHNPNLGGGLMFRTQREDGSPIDAGEARARADLERLVEVMQHKGDSECKTGLGNQDELCGFEKLEMQNFAARYAPLLAKPPLPHQFVRNVLEEGLALDARLGVNPFQFGLIASTDTHLGTPGLVAESADYPGHGGAGTPVGDAPPRGLPDALDFNPGGLAVLWAEENTRASLFAALKRREAYGTSGPRLNVRFFGGWSFDAGLCEADDLVEIGYREGVPMGGTLPRPPRGAAAPRFVVSALRDPGASGLPLQRVQIVKGWLEGEALREAVWEVAGDPGNGADVDLSSCEPRGAGFDALCAVWRDPDFDPAERAFYYARAVENPRCRWSQQLCVARGVRCEDPATLSEELAACCSEQHVRSIQERAWSSPIWYRP